MSRVTLVAVAACVASLAGCGGSGSDLFGEDPGNAVEAGALDASSPGADAGGVPGRDAGASPLDGAATDAGAPRDDAAAAPDAPVAPVDAGPIRRDPGIYCGQKGGADVHGPVATGACCAGNAGNGNGNGGPRYRCTRVGAACNGPSIECDDQADCNGAICCATLVDNTYDSARCAATCKDGPRTTTVRLCDPKAPVDECAALGLQCRASTLLPGFYRCN
jgi:hypothetical protein